MPLESPILAHRSCLQEISHIRDVLHRRTTVLLQHAVHSTVLYCGGIANCRVDTDFPDKRKVLHDTVCECAAWCVRSSVRQARIDLEARSIPLRVRYLQCAVRMQRRGSGSGGGIVSLPMSPGQGRSPRPEELHWAVSAGQQAPERACGTGKSDVGLRSLSPTAGARFPRYVRQADLGAVAGRLRVHFVRTAQPHNPLHRDSLACANAVPLSSRILFGTCGSCGHGCPSSREDVPKDEAPPAPSYRQDVLWRCLAAPPKLRSGRF